MLSFPDDKAVGNYANFGRINAAMLYIGTTAAYFPRHTYDEEAKGRPGRNYISPLKNCGLRCPMREVTAFGPRQPVSRNAAEVGARTSSALLRLKFFRAVTRAECISEGP